MRVTAMPIFSKSKIIRLQIKLLHNPAHRHLVHPAVHGTFDIMHPRFGVLATAIPSVVECADAYGSGNIPVESERAPTILLRACAPF